MRQGTMLNAYPDSLGKNLSEAITFLSMPEMKDAFQSILCCKQPLPMVAERTSYGRKKSDS